MKLDKLLLEQYSIVTAEILYRLPDYQSIIQTYIWQEYDREPEFPRLNQFLEFWETNLDGPLYKVRIAHSRLISAREIAFTNDTYLS
jgi:uncharacterized protein Usg